MMQRHKFIDWVDQYIKNELESDDKIAFESFCATNPEYAELFNQHKIFLDDLKQSDQRKLFQEALSNEGDKQPDYTKSPISEKVISIWKKLQINAAVAAAIALLSVFSTLWITGYFSSIKKATSDYSALRREVNSVKRNVNEQNRAIENINKKDNSQNVVPSHYGATGFMLTKDGYVVTNYHVVNGADSIQLQNNKGQSFRAEIVHLDAQKDLAILHINDSLFLASKKTLPYTFKKQPSEIGEDIFTIGFPRDEAVYGQGYLSSSTGYAGDTVAYQISIPVNPGNSGGPVLDNQGNIIGIISGKQKGIDGAAFAIKTNELIQTLNKIPAESLKGNIVLNNKNTLYKMPRTEQVKKVQEHIFIVKVY